MAYDDLKILTGVSATSELFPDTVFKHEVAELGFPNIEADFEEFTSAGPAGHDLQVFTGKLQALVVTLKMLGNNSKFYAALLKKSVWTFNGVVRNDDTGVKTPYTVTVTAMLGKITPEARSNKALHHHDYEFRGITSMTIVEDGRELYDWGRKRGTRINGVQVDAEDTAILG